MKVVIKEPQKKPYITEINSGLNVLQKQVGGWIENVYELENKKINIWINEEGKINNLTPNFYIYDGYDIVVGTAVFTGFNEDGESVSLTEKQIKDILQYLENRTLLVL